MAALEQKLAQTEKLQSRTQKALAAAEVEQARTQAALAASEQDRTRVQAALTTADAKNVSNVAEIAELRRQLAKQSDLAKKAEQETRADRPSRQRRAPLSAHHHPQTRHPGNPQGLRWRPWHPQTQTPP